MLSRVARLPYDVRGEVQRARVGRREHDGLRTNGAVAGARGGDGRDVLRLADPAVVPRQLSAVDHVGIERVGRRVAVFLHRDGVPFAKRDLPVGAATRDTCGSALLLTAAQVIREGVVRGDVEHLRGRLVV